MNTQTELLLDYQEMAILALREELKKVTAERDYFFNQLNKLENETI